MSTITNYFSVSSINALKQQTENFLTPQQKQVRLVVLAIFAALAACVAAYLYFFKAKIDQPKKTLPPQQDVVKDTEVLMKEAEQMFPPNVDKEFYRKVIIETGYLKDPTGYMRRWEMWRGTMHVENAQDYRAKVISRACDKASSLDVNVAGLFVKYVECISDTGILVDKPAYLKQWREQRGWTEIYYPGQDDALSFFEKLGS